MNVESDKETSPPPNRVSSEQAKGGATFTVHPNLRVRLEQAQRPLESVNAELPSRFVPRSTTHLASQLTFVQTVEEVACLVDTAKQTQVLCVGMDFEYRHRRPGIFIKRTPSGDRYWDDPRSIVPLLLGITLLEQNQQENPRLLRFVVDCRKEGIPASLAPLFRLPVPFITHYARAELFCLWQLGLPVPDQIWDTWAAERAFHLGLFHARYTSEQQQDQHSQIQAEEKAEEEANRRLGLLSTCKRRGIEYPFADNKKRLQQSFREQADHVPFSQEQLEYVSADAEAVALLYPIQMAVAVQQGCVNHLVTVEMPWSVTNSRMCWDGVRVSADRCQQLLGGCQRHLRSLTDRLRELGIHNPNSHPQLIDFFQREGLLDLFKSNGGHSFDDEHLEATEDRHAAVHLIRNARKVGRLLQDKCLTGELVGADGRLHPDHKQLGAESGRNSMRDPNIGGIGRALRPIVVPDEGCVIGEVDLSQIEVGIAAAVYHDPALIAMFNGRDVYSTMARRYFAAELPAEALKLTDKEFKKRYRQLRDRMKVCTLATIYNITPFGLAARRGITEQQAKQEQEQFMQLFPALAQALREASDCGVIRGFAYLCSGVRRWRARKGLSSQWEINWLRNTPVQGSAGVIFKVAGNRLYCRYQRYGARLILPLHDAFVFEVPRQHLQAVAKITAEVFRSAVQEYFPELEPQVEVNITQPSCWNKDGKARSLALWLINPELARTLL